MVLRLARVAPVLVLVACGARVTVDPVGSGGGSTTTTQFGGAGGGSPVTQTLTLTTNPYTTTSTSTSTTPTSTPWSPFTIGAGGYVTTGPWHGYAWTSLSGYGSKISPADYSTVIAGTTELCAIGTVGPTSDYSGAAMLGVNLNQSESGALGTVVPSGAGISYSLTQLGGSELRAQIQASDGDTNPSHRWCATLTGPSGTIPWSSFNTQCWDGSGVAYDGKTPLLAFLIVVPGGNTTATSFDFCLTKFAPL